MTEMGSTHVTFFRTNPKDTHLSTIIIRGATPNILDDVERAIDDGVNVYKVAAPQHLYLTFCLHVPLSLFFRNDISFHSEKS